MTRFYTPHTACWRRESQFRVLLGDSAVIHSRTAVLGLTLGEVRIIDPGTSVGARRLCPGTLPLRQRRGVTLVEARTLLEDRNVCAAMMVHREDAETRMRNP
jgi:phosphotransacetylase